MVVACLAEVAQNMGAPIAAYVDVFSSYVIVLNEVKYMTNEFWSTLS
jgi:hypothetical protein